jgi:hypothetical protein
MSTTLSSRAALNGV